MLWIKVLRGKLTVGLLPNMESEGPLIIFTRALYWTLSSATLIKSISSHTVYLRSISVSASYLSLGLRGISSLQIFGLKFVYISHLLHTRLLHIP
jgi:hypothetical protein